MTADWCLWCVVLLAFFQVCAQIHGWHGFTPFILVCLWFKGNYAAHRFSSGTYVKTRCFSQKAATWNIHVIQNTDSCCSLACRRARTNPIATPGRRRKWASGIVRADLPKLVTQLRDSRQASKVCFDRLSAPPLTPPPHPSRASINPGHSLPRSWSCVHINCQLVATGGRQKVKRQSGPSWQCTGSAADTLSGGGSGASTPVPAHTPSKAFSAVVSNLGERLQNGVAQWLTTTEAGRSISPTKSSDKQTLQDSANYSKLSWSRYSLCVLPEAFHNHHPRWFPHT